MGQPGREHEKGAVADLDHHLIGVLGGEFRDPRPDNPRLRPGMVEIDGVGTFKGAQIVDAAPEVVGVAVDGVGRAFRVDVCPQAG